MRLYVVTTESGQEWLTRGSSASSVMTRWQCEAKDGACEPAIRVVRPDDLAQIRYLREHGQADA